MLLFVFGICFFVLFGGFFLLFYFGFYFWDVSRFCHSIIYNGWVQQMFGFLTIAGFWIFCRFSVVFGGSWVVYGATIALFFVLHWRVVGAKRGQFLWFFGS